MIHTEQSLTYTLSVTVTRPVRVYDFEYTVAETLEWMVGKEAKAELTREVFRALRSVDGDCDVEVLDHALTPEG